MKNLLSREKDSAKGLLAYRSTSLAFKFSPAQLLMGRQLSLTHSGMIWKTYVKKKA